MFVELLEFLRCPQPHEESPLVVSAEHAENRHIITGTLGCPVCRSEFPIRDGALLIDDAAPAARHEPPDAETAMRLAAFLELTDARGFAIIGGGWCNHAGMLRQLAETSLLLVNPPVPIAFAAEGILQVTTQLPVAGSTARSAAVDFSLSAETIASIVHAVRTGGRIVGPAAQPLPAGVTEVVRDDRAWVAEKTAAPGDHAPAPQLVRLTRA